CFSGAELLGGAGVGAPTLELADGVAHGGARLQGHSTNIALGSWIWKPTPGIVRVELLRLARGGRQEARGALRVRGQVCERIKNIEAGGARERAELLAELVEVGPAPHKHGAALEQRLQRQNALL